VTALARGRRKRTYPADHYRTPLEKLKSPPNWQSHLKPTITAERLETFAQKMSDTEAARKMQSAKNTLLTKCRIKVIGFTTPSSGCRRPMITEPREGAQSPPLPLNPIRAQTAGPIQKERRTHRKPTLAL
jgi:hypothetical protein